MLQISDGIRYLRGCSQILAVAPHGPVINGEYQNDVRTGLIAEELHRDLGCSAIINDRFFKPNDGIPKDAGSYFLDVFRIDHARKVPGYLELIKAIAESDNRTLVIWLHGMADDIAASQGQLHCRHDLLEGKSSDLHALMGFGQGEDPKTGEKQDRLTARPATVEDFSYHLSTEGMTTVPTWKGGPNFRGRDAKRLNQWFNQLGHDFKTVESIQLVIKEKGFRDTDANARKTAHIISRAMIEMQLI